MKLPGESPSTQSPASCSDTCTLCVSKGNLFQNPPGAVSVAGGLLPTGLVIYLFLKQTLLFRAVLVTDKSSRRYRDFPHAPAPHGQPPPREHPPRAHTVPWGSLLECIFPRFGQILMDTQSSTALTPPDWLFPGTTKPHKWHSHGRRRTKENNQAAFKILPLRS